MTGGTIRHSGQIIFREVLPFRIQFPQVILFLAPPGFDFFLARDCRNRVNELFVIDEAIEFAPCREAFHYMIFVLPNPPFELARHACVENGAATIGHHVNIEVFHVPHPSSRAQARELAYTHRSHKLTCVINNGLVRSLAVCAVRDDERRG